jgi:hypothetical protein
VCAALVVVGAGQLSVAMALTATRQWRFLPRARARDATLLIVAGALVAIAAIGVSNGAWWCLLVLAVGVALVLVVGRPVLANSDRLGALVAAEQDHD